MTLILHRMGFTGPTRLRVAGELLPRLSILTISGGLFLLHYPYSCLHRTLSGILLCGARTFLECSRCSDLLLIGNYLTQNIDQLQEKR